MIVMAPSQMGIEWLAGESRQEIAEDKEGAEKPENSAKWPTWRRVARGGLIDHEGARQRGVRGIGGMAPRSKESAEHPGEFR